MSDFVSWVLSSERSQDEACAAESLITAALGHWRRLKGISFSEPYEVVKERAEARRLNPAYRPVFDEDEVANAAEVLPELQVWNTGVYDDRPVRSLSVLQWAPELTELNLRLTEIHDWSPLELVPKLEVLHIHDRVGEDLRPIAKLKRLARLWICLHRPWPHLPALDDLPALQWLHYCGNLQVLGDMKALPSVTEADITHLDGFQLPLRAVNALPDMPKLRRLKLINTDKLDGLERCPRLINLEIYGYFRDLSPLKALTELTHLELSGGWYPDASALVALPNLRWVKLRREEPQDVSVLAEVPRLHEVIMEACPILKTEVAALNAGLTPWDEEFAVEPRPLKPLRFRADGEKSVERKVKSAGGVPRDWGDNREMAAAEARWFANALDRALAELLGREWGKLSTVGSHPGTDFLVIARFDDISRIREVVELCRQHLCRTKYPWSLYLTVDSMWEYERDLEDFGDDDEDEEDEEFDEELEREEWEYYKQRERERREFFERLHRYRLKQEQGDAIDPREFAIEKPKTEEENATAGDIEGGSEYDLGTELYFQSTLTEEEMVVSESDKGLAEYLMGMKVTE